MKIRKRFTKVIWIFFKIFLDFSKEYKLRRKKGFEYSQKVMEKTHIKRSKELYTIAISLGGVLIKLCQYLSTRRDIFPEPYIKTLSELQDNVPPVEYQVIEKIIKEEYEEKNYPFSQIEEIPLASASLGQVHKAILKTGEKVVLKVLKPEIEKIIDIDFAILFYVFKIFSHIKSFKQISEFSSILDEFIKVTGDELNFQREVVIGKKFKTALKKFDYLIVPYVYEEFSNRRIIVMELIDGTKITDKNNWVNRNNDPLIIARRIIEIYFEQFLYIKLIHFDPHPGNIFVLENNNMALLDFGMAGEITDEMSDSIKDGIEALVKKDYIKILEILKDLGFLKKNTDIYAFLPIMEYFFDEILDTLNLEHNSMQKIDFSPIIDDLVEIIYTQPFKLPYEWAYIGRTVGTITGIISLLCPDFKITDELKPYFDKILKYNLTDIIEKSGKTAKDSFLKLINLPNKVDSIINKIERGNLKFKVDFEDVDDKITNLGAIFGKGIAIGLTFLSGTVAYILFTLKDTEGIFIFGGISFISLVYSFFYKKKTKREIIKKTIMK